MRAVLPLVTATASGVVYQLAQKTAPASRPWPMLAIAYGAAFTLTLGLALTASGPARALPVRGEWSAGLALGLAAFGIEASFFFLYRAGWPLVSASVIAGAMVTTILAIAGIVVFGEHLGVMRGAGLALATAGAALMARG